MSYLFQNATAFDPYTGRGVPNASGQVFAMADAAFAAPLAVILLSSGLQTTELVSDQYSQLPGFDAGDNVQVRFRSGEFTKILNTSTPLVGPQGDTGKSAFEVAVEGGYTGTEAEYNATLTDAPSLVARAETAETAAVNAANLVGAPADTAIATAINGPGTQTQTALSAAIGDVSALLRPGVNLDIWPGMDPIPSTYAAWISGIDSELGGVATKTVIGKDSYNADMHLYESGGGKRTVLLVAGQHPWEVLGQVAARQFFIQFATSNHPSMQVLRQQIRLLWIPTVISGYFRGGRSNKNNVDLNRNYAWNWARTVSSEKGNAPFDQPETQVIKSVIDNYPVSLVFDCHNFGVEETRKMEYATAPNAIQGKVLTMDRAHSAWASANPDAPTAKQYNDSGTLAPRLEAWAQKYMRYDLGRTNAMTTLFECSADFGGSDQAGSVMTRSAARWYSSFIYQTILVWLESGQTDEPVSRFVWRGSHNKTRSSLPFNEGGHMVANTAWEPLLFASTSNGTNKSYVPVPTRHPGTAIVNATVSLENTGGVAGTVYGALSSTQSQSPSRVPSGSTFRAVSFDATVGGRMELTLQGVFESSSVLDDAVREVQLWLMVSPGATVEIRPSGGVTMLIEQTWNDGPNYQPLA